MRSDIKAIHLVRLVRFLSMIGLFFYPLYWISTSMLANISEWSEWPKTDTLVVECHDGCIDSVFSLSLNSTSRGILDSAAFDNLARSLQEGEEHLVYIDVCAEVDITGSGICRTDYIVGPVTHVYTLPTNLTPRKAAWNLTRKAAWNLTRLLGHSDERAEYRYKYGSTFDFKFVLIFQLIIAGIILLFLVKYLSWEINPALDALRETFEKRRKKHSREPVTRVP